MSVAAERISKLTPARDGNLSSIDQIDGMRCAWKSLSSPEMPEETRLSEGFAWLAAKVTSVTIENCSEMGCFRFQCRSQPKSLSRSWSHAWSWLLLCFRKFCRSSSLTQGCHSWRTSQNPSLYA